MKANNTDSVTPLAVKPRVDCRMGGWGRTRLRELINDGELESYRDGRSRLITVASIERYIARKLAAAQDGKVV
jgi:excisionase family DNA binding protein